jgi:hypothetical protein
MTTRGDLRERVTKHLARILGKPLWGGGRAADLLWLQFGDRHLAPAIRGGARELGEYALHVQCAWRISCAQGIASASDLTPESRIGESLSVFVSSYCTALVQSIDADERGGFSIRLAGGCIVQVLPEGEAEEQWRLFSPGREGPHVVLVGTEVSEE